MKEIPILLYHNIGHYPSEMMEDGLSPETFAYQMLFLSENIYNVVTIDQALDHLSGKINLPPKSIVITIDGGYKDVLTNVLPILKLHKFHATFFIIPEYIGNERFINGRPIPCLEWNEVYEIYCSGMEIGLLGNGGKGIKNQYDEKSIKESVSNSLDIMKDKLNAQIKYCAFKEGVPRKTLWDFLQRLGFQAIFTQCPTNQKSTPAGIGRIQIDDDDHNIFLTKISNTYLFFKDKPSWKYIRRYHMDKLAHRLSETWNRITGDH